MTITLLCISDSDKHFASALAEYMKRMNKTVDIINIKPVKHGSRQQIIDKETVSIIAKITKKKYTQSRIYLLSKEGKAYTSERFGKLLIEKYVPTTFIIGWPYGLDEEQLASYIHWKISLGIHTMPHGLAKLVLLEQIYRATTIISGKSYHY